MLPTPEQLGSEGDSAIGRLEIGVSALIRWMESRQMRARVARESGVDLTTASIGLLEHLDVAGAMRVSDIAECHCVDASTMTVRIQALQRDRLVKRRPDPTDGRASLVVISDEGRAAVGRLREARRGLLAEIFGELDPAEVERAARLLCRVEQHMIGTMHDEAPLLSSGD
jgi:DNA-binding MarR family transcriptional regulator